MSHSFRIAQGAARAGLGLALALGPVAPALASTGQGSLPTGEYAPSDYEAQMSRDASSQGTTDLYITTQKDDLTAPEGTQAAQMRVSIPVAIHYVADANGNLIGPSDNKVMFVNRTSFGAVHVSKIHVDQTAGLSVVSNKEKMNTNEISLSVRPVQAKLNAGGTLVSGSERNGTGDELANYTEGRSPVNRDEWNIAGDRGVLMLNGLGGRAGKLSALDTGTDQQVGTIRWTVRLGTREEADGRDSVVRIHFNLNGGTHAGETSVADQVVPLLARNPDDKTLRPIEGARDEPVAYQDGSIQGPRERSADGTETTRAFKGWYRSPVGNDEEQPVAKVGELGQEADLGGTVVQLYARYE